MLLSRDYTNRCIRQHQMESFSKSFSESLKRLRGDRSQAEFARFLGIEHQATYQRYEAGRIPDGDVLYQMATRLGITMEDLLLGKKLTSSPVVVESRDNIIQEAEDFLAFLRLVKHLKESEIMKFAEMAPRIEEKLKQWKEKQRLGT